MILKSQLKNIIEEANHRRRPLNFIARQPDLSGAKERIIVLSGVRRCGKSTMMKHHYFGKENNLFINFEDPRLERFETEDIEKLAEIIKEKKADCLLLDELQNLKSWEKLARFFHDRNLKVVITGSNSSMLSKELGSKLTGRYKQFELFPFNFEEYSKYLKCNKNMANFKKHLLQGGFPEYLMEQSDDYLHTLVNNIVIRDVAVRRNIRNENLLLRLVVFLFSNIGKPFSYNKLSNYLEIKSVRTTIDYCDYLEESYLVEFLPQFSWSAKKQQIRPKKVYSIDTGLARANSLSLQDDWGRLLENYVFLSLRQKQYELYYWKSETSECDFITKIGKQITHAIQVCWELTPDNIQRELKGLKDAMTDTGAETGYLITYNQEEMLDGFKLIPAWKMNSVINGA